MAATVTAQERTLPTERAAGHDSVVTQCISFARVKFADVMCDRLSGSIAKLATANGLTHVELGKNEWGFGKDEYLEIPANADVENPVWLTLYIRATPEPTSMNIWVSLYKPVAPGSPPDWKPGRLVIWEDSGIGAGDVEIITDGLANGIAAKLEPVFKVLGEAR